MNRLTLALLSLTVALVLASCGGGGSEDDGPTTMKASTGALPRQQVQP